MYVVMLVLDDPQHLHAVLSALRRAGARSVTIAETTGAQRVLTGVGRVPTRYVFGRLAAESMQGNYTLWAVVPDEQTARACLTAVEGVMGDLDRPDTGILLAWPVAFAKGIPSASSREGENPSCRG